MAKETFFSPIMPFAMRPESPNRPARYHSGHLDTEWQKDLIQDFQMDYQYAQKWEFDDPFRFQAKSTADGTGGSSVTLYLVSCAGDYLASIASTATTSVAGDLTTDGTQLVTYQYSYQDIETAAGLTLTEGIYYMLYRVVYPGGNVSMRISEPIELGSFPETLLFEYSNSAYKYGVPFASIPVRFRLRVEGYISQMVPKSVSTVYQDQNYDTATLDFNPYRNWTLFLGQDGFGIPYWLIDKLNRILGLDNILIDGKQYTAASANPSWTIDGPETTPLKAASVDIQEANDAEDFTDSDRVIDLYTSPGFPYALSALYIGPWKISNAVRIADSTAETAYIAALNAGLGSSELIGTIAKVSGVIQYTNGPGENYTTSTVQVFTTKLTWSFTPSVPPLTLDVGIWGNGVMAWGDASVEQIDSPSTVITFSHTYGSAAIYSVEFWTVNLRRFYLTTTQPSGLTALAGTMPSNLQLLSVSSCAFASNNFNFAFVAPAATSLDTLHIFNCGITAYSNMVFYTFTKLKTVNFSGNAMSQTNMNDFINDVKTTAVISSILNGTLNAVQVPPQALNATGTAAKSTLVSMGWTVNP